MTINFIANDPMATGHGFTANTVNPSPDRPATSSGIEVSALPPEAVYVSGTAEFVAWQAREAALRAIMAVETASGPLPGWIGDPNRRQLSLVPIAGQDLNAYYDRASISFFVTRIADRDVFSGSSTDVVAHETGHAILDAMRPDFWNANMMEVGAFHEGFGDVVAILTALSDRATREYALAAGLRQPNDVEATAEELSDAILKVYGPAHPASAPRRALNTFKWSFPTSLPANGPPDVLINEEHSLGQLLSGIFYDLICEIYTRAAVEGEAALWKAAQTAMDLTMRAIATVSVRPRFFEAWGRTMAVIDAQSFEGANWEAIKTAFSNHGFMISRANFLAPRVRLVNATARQSRAKSLVTPNAKGYLRSAMGIVEGQALHRRDVDFGDGAVVEMSAAHSVDLTGLSERLAGVAAQFQQPALVGEVDNGPALLGAVDPTFAYEAEVRAYVASLLTHQSIDFGTQRNARQAEAGVAVAAGAGIVAGAGVTHAVVSKGGHRVLERKSFACGCKCARIGRRT